MAKKILIVDDDPEIQSYLSDFLGDNGYTTVTAADGEQALKALDEEKPDLMTLDIEMPNVSGPWLNRLKEKQGKGTDLPIIVIAGHGGLKYTIPTAVAQFDKPFDREEVLKKIKEVLGS